MNTFEKIVSLPSLFIKSFVEGFNDINKKEVVKPTETVETKEEPVVIEKVKVKSTKKKSKK